MITIKHLVIFKEVARVKSMSKAAENLFISQPTISQKIQEIENYYHIKLFQRFSKSLGISEEGEIFLEHANKVLMELETLDEIFFYNKENINIRIGTTLTIASTIAPILFHDIQQKHPHLHLQVYVDNTQSIENMLLDNQLDIAIVEGDIHSDMVVHQPIIEDQLALVCSCENELYQCDTVDPKQLQHQSFVVREKGSGTRAMLEQFMNIYKLAFHVTWQCHSWESVKQAVIFNHGLSLISLRLVEKELQEGLLHVVNIDNWKWDRNFSLCYHKNKAWNPNLETIKQEAILFSKELKEKQI